MALKTLETMEKLKIWIWLGLNKSVPKIVTQNKLKKPVKKKKVAKDSTGGKTKTKVKKK